MPTCIEYVSRQVLNKSKNWWKNTEKNSDKNLNNTCEKNKMSTVLKRMHLKYYYIRLRLTTFREFARIYLLYLSMQTSLRQGQWRENRNHLLRNRNSTLEIAFNQKSRQTFHTFPVPNKTPLSNAHGNVIRGFWRKKLDKATTNKKGTHAKQRNSKYAWKITRAKGGKTDEKMSFHPALPNPLSAVMSGYFSYLPGTRISKKVHLM